MKRQIRIGLAVVLLTTMVFLSCVFIGCAGKTPESNIIIGDVGEAKIAIFNSDNHWGIDAREAETKALLREWLGRDDIAVLNLDTIYQNGLLVGFELTYTEK